MEKEKEFVSTESNLIEGFLKEYLRSRVTIETTVRSVLKRALQYEEIFEKNFINFNKEEALTMFKEAGAISVTSLQNSVLILRHATTWINFERQIKADNIYETIGKDELKGCIVKREFISYEQLQEIQSNLLNATDKAIIELLFEGVGGRWCTELTYLEPHQVSREDMCIYFKTGKRVSIKPNCYKLLQKAFNEREFISYNPESMKVSIVYGTGIYKVRNNTIHSNDDVHDEQDQERRFRYIQRRLKIISDHIGIKLTVSMLQNSGLYYYIQEGMEEKKVNFREFVHTQEARQLAKCYDIYSDLYIQILVDKFGEYL